MKSKFYSHILKIEPINSKFGEYEISDSQRDELLDILHTHVHITVIDVILSELDDDKKKEFLHLIALKEDHSAAWDFVITNIEKGEDKVKEAIDSIVKEFVSDLEKHSL